MRARDVMTKGVLAVSADTPASEAARFMHGRRIHHLLVKDGSRRAGIVSDRDLGGRLAATATGSRTVGSLMTPHVVTVDVDATIRQIANVMRGRSIGCVVVTDRERTVGLITVSDLLALIGRGVERPIAQNRRHALHYRTGHRHKASSSGVW
jgi:CBS domain-containing protein